MTHPPAPEKIENLKQLLEVLAREIKGQCHAVPRTVSALQRGELGLTKPGRPRSSFLLQGPTGVGKTETVVVATDHLCGPEKRFRFDMSEFQNQESVGLLLGARSGERGYLVAVQEKATKGSVLFDEVEKAHPRVLDLLLQLLDAARVTVATVETLDMSGFHLWLTSNIGAAEILGLQHSTDATLERHVLAKPQQSLRPKIFARIAEKIVFHRLPFEVQMEIAEKFLERELAFLRERGIEIRSSPDVVPFLVRKGFHPKLGARPMRDTIERLVGEFVGQRLLRCEEPEPWILNADSLSRQ